MIYLKSVVSWFGNMQFLSMLCMLRCAFLRKVSRGRSALLMAGCAVGFALTNGVFNMAAALNNSFESIAFAAFVMLVLGFCALYGHLALKVPMRQLICSIIFFMSFVEISLMISIAAGTLCGLSTDTGRVMCLPLVALLCVWLRRVTRAFRIQLPMSYWCVALLTPILMNVLVLLWQGQMQMTAGHFLLNSSMLFCMDLSTYYFFGRMVRKMEEQMDAELENKLLTFHIQQMEEIHAVLENTRTLRHEMKSQFFLIESLLKEGNSDEAVRYIEQQIKPAFAKEERVSTGNGFVDMVLSQKVTEARSRNISVALDVLLPEKLPIDQEMLCSLLFNLWDNAIEASQKASAPDIHFSMSVKKSYLNIVISNYIDESVLKTNPKLQTSKKDPLRHGVGIRLIRRVVDQNHGDLKIYEENGYFVIHIFLELEDTAEDTQTERKENNEAAGL